MPLDKPPSLVQTQFAEISADTTTNSTSFVDLLTLTFNTFGGDLDIEFDMSASATTTTMRQAVARVLLDGTSKKGCGTQASDYTNSAMIKVKVTGVSPGSHTVKAQWKTDGGTIQIRPVAASDAEHASLLVSEVMV